MPLQSEEWIGPIQREDADVVVVATGGDEAARVRLIGGDDAHAGHEVGVAVHAEHLHVAPLLTTEAEITGKETTRSAWCQFHTASASQQLFPVYKEHLEHLIKKNLKFYTFKQCDDNLSLCVIT